MICQAALEDCSLSVRFLVCVCQGKGEGALGVAAQPGGDQIRPLREAQETEI